MQIDVEVNNGWDFPSHPTNTIKRRIHMLATILQTLLKLSVLFGLVFMIVCTVFVIACIIKGDIKINIIRNEAEKENE
jgi:uncharacterized membrane protein